MEEESGQMFALKVSIPLKRSEDAMDEDELDYDDSDDMEVDVVTVNEDEKATEKKDCVFSCVEFEDAIAGLAIGEGAEKKENECDQPTMKKLKVEEAEKKEEKVNANGVKEGNKEAKKNEDGVNGTEVKADVAEMKEKGVNANENKLANVKAEANEKEILKKEGNEKPSKGVEEVPVINQGAATTPVKQNGKTEEDSKKKQKVGIFSNSAANPPDRDQLAAKISNVVAAICNQNQPSGAHEELDCGDGMEDDDNEEKKLSQPSSSSTYSTTGSDSGSSSSSPSSITDEISGFEETKPESETTFSSPSKDDSGGTTTSSSIHTPYLEISEDYDRHEINCRFPDFAMHKQSFMTDEALEDAFYESELPMRKMTKSALKNVTWKGYTAERTRKLVAEKKRKATLKLREKIQRKLTSPAVVYYMDAVKKTYESFFLMYQAQCYCPKARGSPVDEIVEIAETDLMDMDTSSTPTPAPVPEPKVAPIRIPFPPSAEKRKLTPAEVQLVTQCGVDLSESDSDEEDSSDESPADNSQED